MRLLPLLLQPLTQRPIGVPASSMRCNEAVVMMATDSLKLTDTDADSIRFDLSSSGSLAMFVQDELHCAAVASIQYDPDVARVITEGATEEERGSFSLKPDNRQAEVDALRGLAARAASPRVEWRDVDPLPAQIEALLVDDTLRATRPGTRILWGRLKTIYPSEEAALNAVKRNSALVLPYLNRPYNIDGSWKVLLGMMSEEEALDVVTKNPGVLASNPQGLAGSNAAAIKQAAGVVDVVEAVPVPLRFGASAAVTVAVVALVGSKYVDLTVLFGS